MAGPPLIIAKNEDYGVAPVMLTSQLTALPGINPHESVMAFYTEPQVGRDNIEFYQDRQTGQNLVRLKDGTHPQSLDIHYVVQPLTVKPGHETLREPCQSEITRQVESLFQAKPELKQQLSATSPRKLANTLISYCRGFVDDPLTGQGPPGLLYHLINEKKGTCRHRTWAFCALAEYFGLSARIVSNPIHCWPEYSLDGGRSWQAGNLGGGGICTINYKEPERVEGVIGNRLAPDRIAALMALASQDKEAFARQYGMTLKEVQDWLDSEGRLPLPLDLNKLLVKWKESSLDTLELLIEQIKTKQFQPAGDDSFDNLAKHTLYLLCVNSHDRPTTDRLLRLLEESILP